MTKEDFMRMLKRNGIEEVIIMCTDIEYLEISGKTEDGGPFELRLNQADFDGGLS